MFTVFISIKKSKLQTTINFSICFDLFNSILIVFVLNAIDCKYISVIWKTERFFSLKFYMRENNSARNKLFSIARKLIRPKEIGSKCAKISANKLVV